MSQANQGAQIRDQTVDLASRTYKAIAPREEASGLVSGITMGVRSAIGGATAGLTTLFGAPVLGTASGGATGCAMGIGAGAIGAISFPIMGIALGAYHVGQGLIRTPQAIKFWVSSNVISESDRKLTDPEKLVVEATDRDLYSESRRWILAELNGEDEAVRMTAVVKDKDFYDVLGVRPDASFAEVRKAYYIQSTRALEELGSDRDAVNFNKIAEAYQVLSDKKLRDLYDESGKTSLVVPEFNACELYTMSFGHKEFGPLIGELTVVTALACSSEDHSTNLKQVKEIQLTRENALARHLADLLDVWIVGDEERFVENAIQESERLSQVPFGAQMLHLIGGVYISVGKQMLGYQSPFGIAGRMRVITEKFAIFKSTFAAIEAAAELKELENVDLTEASTSEADVVLDKVLSRIFFINALDIESTLRKVCKQVCSEESVVEDARVGRCVGLVKLGEIFQASGMTSLEIEEEN